MHFKGRDVVSIDQLTKDEILYLIKEASKFAEAEKKGTPICNMLRDRAMAYAFFEPSTRTRLSFMRAARRQGMDRFGFGSAESTSMKKNESIHHTLAMLEGYRADVLVIRHGLDGTAQYAADVLKIPVINAGDGRHEHPTQTITDLFTIQETQGKLEGLKIALVGDLKYGRTPHSLIKALRRFSGNRFFLVHPQQLGMPDEFTHHAVDGATTLRDDIVQNVTLEQAIRTCDIVYMTRIQAERIEDERERKEAWGKVQLRPEMFTNPNPGMKILHPLPIDAEHPEIPKTFYRDFPQYAHFFQQAANGLIVREVLLCALLGAIGEDFNGEKFSFPSYNDRNSLIPLEIRQDKQASREYTLKPVMNGTVIDHLPHGMAVRIYHALLEQFQGALRLAEGMPSASMGKKDILMIDNYELKEEELNTVAIISPGVTINIIRDQKVVAKGRTQLPDRIKGLLECSNTRCVSHNPHEDAPSIFYFQRESEELRCHYCDTLHSVKRGNLKIR